MNPLDDRSLARKDEDSAARASRLTETLRGLLKDELAAYGGGEAFLRWMRSDHDEPASDRSGSPVDIEPK